MRRRHSVPLSQQLRQLIRDNRREEVYHLLEQILLKHPDHELAKAEWYRLQMGQQLLTEQEMEQDKQRNKQKQIQRINELCARINASPLELKKINNKKLQQQLESLQELLVSATPEEAVEWKHAQQALLSEQAQRARRQKKRYLNIAASVLALASITALGFFLTHRAEQAAHSLEQALRIIDTNPIEARHILNQHATGLNKLLNREAAAHAHKLNYIINTREKRRHYLMVLLSQVMNQTLSLTDIAPEIHQEMRQYAKWYPEMQKALTQIHQHQSIEAEEQRQHFMHQFSAPLPALPALTGIPETDLPALQQQEQLLLSREKLFEQIRDFCHLQQDDITPVQQERQKLQALIKEVQQLAYVLSRLPFVHNQQSYLHTIQQAEPQLYTPLYDVWKNLSLIPTLQKTTHFILCRQYELSREQLTELIHTTIEQGPSFTAHLPASLEQIMHLTDLFDNEALRTPLILMQHKNGARCYTEQEPVVNKEQQRVIIQRSELDPEHDLAQSQKIEWDNPLNITKLYIDTSHLVQLLDLQRESFLEKANLAAALSTVLNLEEPRCPALAKAFVYHTLATVIKEQHPSRTDGSLLHTPTLQQHLTEFEQLREQVGIPLHGTCWLQNTPEAETAYALWFKQHQGANYAKEIATAARKLFDKDAQYTGYINLEGKPILRQQNLNTDAPIWYRDQEGRYQQAPCTTTHLPKAMPLSPIYQLHSRLSAP